MRAIRAFLFGTGRSAQPEVVQEYILDKPVTETSGREIGKVKDVSFNFSGTIALLEEASDGKTAQVPVSKVTGIPDNVAVRGDTQPPAPEASAGPKCGCCGEPVVAGQTRCPDRGKARA